MTSMFRELAPAARRLLRAPGFTSIAILTLALGIGANSAMFSIVNAVLLEPLPYASPERLVRVWGESDRFPKSNVNPVDALDWRAELGSFESLAVFHANEITLLSGGESLRVPHARVTSGYFEMLGVRPVVGTTFGPEAEIEGQDNVALLSYGLWQSTFGGDRSIVGKTISLAETEFTVIGVMPEGYRDPLKSWVGDPVLWRPMAINRETQGRGGHFMQVFARLAPGVSVADAQAEIDVMNRRLEETYPNTNAGYRALIEPLHASIVGDSRRLLVLLMAAVGTVLLIGCVNVANLLLARGAARSRELSIRSSLGASRGALVRMMVAEAFLLAAAGALAALAICRALMGSLGTLVEGRMLVRNPIEIDQNVILFTIGASLAAAVVCSLVPAIQASGARAFTGLRETGRSGGVGRTGRRAMRGLVVAQIALSALVLVAAGLLVRSLQNLTAVDPGFDADRLVAASVRLAPASYPEDPQVFAFHDQLRERLTARPGITNAAITNIMPFGVGHSCDGYLIEGDVEVRGAGPCAETRAVSRTWFETMGIPIVAGRTFDKSDENLETPGIVISRSMAANFRGDPVGQRVRLSINDEPWATVVGVAGDVRHSSLGEEPPPTLYMPFAVNAYYGVMLVVRMDGEPENAIPVVRETIRGLDAAIPVNKIDTLENLVASSLAADRLRTGLLGGFGVLALALAMSGIYGVFSFLVAAARRDTGVRMALGAERRRILLDVLRDVTLLASVGIVIGIVASAGIGRMLETFLHGVEKNDAATLVAVAVAMLVVSVGASYLPARRAMRVDPMQALREE